MGTSAELGQIGNDIFELYDLQPFIAVAAGTGASEQKKKQDANRLAKTEVFRQGIQRVQDGMKNFKLALMCAEKEPLECHRTILVARRLNDLGIDIQHIHATGKLESHADALKRLAMMLNLPQADMFRPQQDMFADAYRYNRSRQQSIDS